MNMWIFYPLFLISALLTKSAENKFSTNLRMQLGNKYRTKIEINELNIIIEEINNKSRELTPDRGYEAIIVVNERLSID